MIARDGKQFSHRGLMLSITRKGNHSLSLNQRSFFASRWLHLAAIVFISRCIVVMSVRREARPRRGRAGAVASFWRRSDADNSLGFMPDSQMREENNDDCGKLKGPFGDSDWKALHKVLHKKVRGPCWTSWRRSIFLTPVLLQTS